MHAHILGIEFNVEKYVYHLSFFHGFLCKIRKRQLGQEVLSLTHLSFVFKYEISGSVKKSVKGFKNLNHVNHENCIATQHHCKGSLWNQGLLKSINVKLFIYLYKKRKNYMSTYVL